MGVSNKERGAVMAKTYLENQIWGTMAGMCGSYEEAYEAYKEGATHYITTVLKKDPNEIQVQDENFTCSICGREVEGEYSHNAWPINDGRCCIECNALKVMPARIKGVR